jgi:hypothetical protein
MGYNATRAGHTDRLVGALRVTLRGAVAMVVTAALGTLFSGSP